MDKKTYWLLETVAEAKIPLYHIRPDSTELNRPPHGLSADELVETLQTLFENGDLMACGQDRFKYLGEFAPSPIQTEIALEGGYGEDLLYALTERGGRLWESVTRPEWSKFLSHSEYRDEFGTVEVEVIGSSPYFVEGYVNLKKWPGNIHLSTDTVQPWQATYWKTLPAGYRARFFYLASEAADQRLLGAGIKMEEPGNETGLAPASEVATDIKEWFESGRQWYKSLWDE